MSFSISSTLEKMNSRDKDFRYMATADLVAELNKDTFKIDADSEKKLTAKVLQLLEDNSNQVQELVVKCLGPLSKRVKEGPLQDIADTLCNHLLHEKKGAEELRDIASIGLRTVILEVPSDPPSQSQALLKRLTPRLLKGIAAHEEKPEVQGYCLEALNELLGRFGTQMEADHQHILQVVQPQLTSKRTANRKRAITCIAHLAVTIPDSMFGELVQTVVRLLRDAGKQKERLRTYIQAIGAISRAVGYRLGKFLPEFTPLVVEYCKLDGDDELRENCFQCFESLILRCPKDITPFLDSITTLCLTYISHDPNYAEEEEDEEEGMDEEGEEGEGEEEGEGGDEDYSDDDDMSWKVRRSAAKCLGELIKSRPERLSQLYDSVAPVLIQRFREREENVQSDIFVTFGDLLRQTLQLLRRNPDVPTLAEPLRRLLPAIVKAVAKQLRAKSVKTRSGALGLLHEVVLVLPGEMGDHVTTLTPGILGALAASSPPPLKMAGLQFLRQLVPPLPPRQVEGLLSKVIARVSLLIADSYYRLAAEALRCAAALLPQLRPLPETQPSSFPWAPLVPPLLKSTWEKLQLQDIDQEVKESAIGCMGLLLAHTGDTLSSELPSILAVLQDRLSNEITRLPAVKAFETIASSPLQLNLSTILSGTLSELSAFLRKANRPLKVAALQTLSVLSRQYATAAAGEWPAVVRESGSVVSDTDLHLTHLSLRFAALLLHALPSAAPAVEECILPPALDLLLHSPLLQGLALDSLLALLRAGVPTGAKGLSYETILTQLLTVTNTEVPKQVLTNVAKAIAAVALSSNEEVRNGTVGRFLRDLSTPSADGKGERGQHLALYALGEMGRSSDLSAHATLPKLCLQAFDSPNEETRQAASFALGNVAVGSLSTYLPMILGEIQKSPKTQYLLLHSLREIILRQGSTAQGITALQQWEGSILPLLSGLSGDEEEGTRTVVGECLGKFAPVSPKAVHANLLQLLKHENPQPRGTAITALKFAIVERNSDLDLLLLPDMPHFLALLQDSDLNVRRNTLLTLSYAAHNRSALIREALPPFLPAIFHESKPNPALVREVDLGPFKHKVDDGLEVRKAAYECILTLLDSCLDKLPLPTLVTHLVDGLKDHHDIKLLTHLILLRLAVLAPSPLLEGLTQLVEPLRATVTAKPKEGAVKQEVDRIDDLVRSALRPILAISRLPAAENNAKWEEFLRVTVKVGDVGEKFTAIKAEGEHSDLSADSMDVS